MGEKCIRGKILSPRNPLDSFNVEGLNTQSECFNEREFIIRNMENKVLQGLEYHSCSKSKEYNNTAKGTHVGKI